MLIRKILDSDNGNVNRKIISFDKISACNFEYLPRETFDRPLNKLLCVAETPRQKWKLKATNQVAVKPIYIGLHITAT